MTEEKFTCCKCNKEQDRSEVFAWDGFDREACLKCFKRWGWTSFGEDFTARPKF